MHTGAHTLNYISHLGMLILLHPWSFSLLDFCRFNTQQSHTCACKYIRDPCAPIDVLVLIWHLPSHPDFHLCASAPLARQRHDDIRVTVVSFEDRGVLRID